MPLEAKGSMGLKIEELVKSLFRRPLRLPTQLSTDRILSFLWDPQSVESMKMNISGQRVTRLSIVQCVGTIWKRY